MRKLSAVYRKELEHYFQSISAYVMISLFLALAGYFFYSIFRYYNYLSFQAGREPSLADNLNLIEGVMRPLMSNVSVVLLFAIPMLTMRLLAEEKRQGTFELLLTYPISDFEAVMGKYLAALSVFAVMLGGTLMYPAMLAIFSDPETGPMVTSYIGLFLMGASFVAMGIFFSSITSSQIVAGAATFAVALFFLIIGWAAPFAGPTLSKVIAQFSILEHFDSFSKGIVNLPDVTYYVFITAFFIFMTLRSLESSHWRT
ncbi:MAG: ABC transporter permease subunit [Candidatus Krumholzibacteria bacterium]|nr:ABC transporter permease subunit [Candidatus Krumholzibacteria bacterium]